MPSTIAPRDITDAEFRDISELLHRRTGIRLAPGKETLVMGRLDKRLRHLRLHTYDEYLRLLESPDQQDEARQAVDLLTTNETFFFREPRHFDFLRKTVVPAQRGGRPLRLWSAASSSGEEAYTAAMVLADVVPAIPWEIVGTDISSRVLERAQRGIYPIEAAERIPPPLLRKYCRRGTQEYDGLMAVVREIRSAVTFSSANLLADLRHLGRFDVILLRNVMIYFDLPTKAGLVARLQEMLYPGGYLIVGLAETISGIPSRLRMVEPSVYQIAESRHA